MPYEGHMTYGIYLSKRKAVKRADEVRAGRILGQDWVDVAELEIGECDPLSEDIVWSSDWPKKRRDSVLGGQK